MNGDMNESLPQQWDWRSLLPIAAGLYWLLANDTPGWWLCALVPGALLLATGVAWLLYPGEMRIGHYLAAGGFLGVVLAVPAIFAGGFGDALGAALLSAASYVASGALTVSTLELLPEDAPAPERNIPMYAKVALDEALLGYFVGTAMIPSGEGAERVVQDVAKARAILKDRGWLQDPAGFHKTPDAPEHVRIERARIYRRDYEVLRFDSGFTADPDLPGAARWSAFHSNDRTCAWMVRQSEPGRPWLLCIHGYRMGVAWLDFTLFPPGWLHDRLGANLVMSVLPLHGPRRAGWRSGDDYLDGDPMDLLHAQTQALWDLRKTVAWIRTQEPDARIGVLGYSLGGYNAALLAAHESSLDFVIAGIPVSDFAATLWRYLPPAHKRYFTGHELDEAAYRDVLHPVSPLAFPPVVPRERRHIFGGVGDRIVLPDQAQALAQHWQAPVAWYQGGHLSFRGERVVRDAVERAMAQAGWQRAGGVPNNASGTDCGERSESDA